MPYKRKGSSRVWITVAGVRRSSGTTDWKDAEALEHKLNHDKWKEKELGIKPPRSWEEAVVKYLKECQGQPSYKWKVAVLKWWAPNLQYTFDIRTITRDKVGAICDPYTNTEPSPRNNTLNKKTAILHNLLQKACQEWEWIERVPKFRTYPIPEHKDKWLTAEQWFALGRALPADLSDFCVLALATGLRSSMIVGLTWGQYDALRRVLNVSGTARKRANPVPLNGTAISVLETRRRSQVVGMTRVFPEFNGPPIKVRARAWAKVRKIPGLEGVGVHTLRHTFNTWLLHAGIPREDRKYLMGHASSDAHEVYTHQTEARLRPAVEVIDEVLNGQTLILVRHEYHRSARTPSASD